MAEAIATRAAISVVNLMSLADRACSTLAKRLAVPVLTAGNQAVAATSRTSQRTTEALAVGLDPGPKRSAIVRAFSSLSQSVSESPLPSSLPVSQVPD